MVALLLWKLWLLKLEVQQNACLALIIQIMLLKQNFLKKSSRTLRLATCYCSIQSYLKIDLILQRYSMCIFYIENHEPFGSLTKNCSKLDKNKSIVSRFSVFVVYNLAASTVQEKNYVGCFNFREWMLVFAHLFLDISIKSTKLHFQSCKKISSNDFAIFL